MSSVSAKALGRELDLWSTRGRGATNRVWNVFLTRKSIRTQWFSMEIAGSGPFEAFISVFFKTSVVRRSAIEYSIIYSACVCAKLVARRVTRCNSGGRRPHTRI
jgi:hypothetical protein